MPEERDEMKFAQRTPRNTRQEEESGVKKPPVSRGEELLYAEEAPLVRILGNAAAAADEAYQLACKMRREFPETDELPERPFGNEKVLDNLDKAMIEAWNGVVATRLAFRNVAARSTALVHNEQDLMEITNGVGLMSTASGSARPEPADPGIPTN